MIHHGTTAHNGPESRHYKAFMITQTHHAR